MADEIFQNLYCRILQYKSLREEFDRFTDCFQLSIQNGCNLPTLFKKLQQNQLEQERHLFI